MSDIRKQELSEYTEEIKRFVLHEVVYKLNSEFVMLENNEYNRNLLVRLISRLCDSVKEANFIYDYKVICDDTNNDQTIIDNNELRVNILYKNKKDDDFILIDFIATRTDTNFENVEEIKI